MELDYGFDVPCVVQWSPLWLSASTRLNKILEQDLNIPSRLHVHPSKDTDRSSPQRATVDKAPMMHRTMQSQRGSGKKSQQNLTRKVKLRKKNTWHKSGRESSKREAEPFTIVESATADEKQEERDRCKIKDHLVEVRKRKDEEDEAMCLIEEMQRNPDAAQNKSFEAEQKLNSILWEYIEAFDKERERPKTTLAKLWQLMQSRDTQNLNLDKDLEEIQSKIKQTKAARTRRFWAQDEDEDQ